jgi:hypothetical protein
MSEKFTKRFTTTTKSLTTASNRPQQFDASRKPVPSFPPSLRLKEAQALGLPCLCADDAGNINSVLVLIWKICRESFSCCGSVASPQGTA